MNNALATAIAEKRRIEGKINEILTEFTSRTGLAVRNIECNRLSNRSYGDEYDHFIYQVKTEIVVDDE